VYNESLAQGILESLERSFPRTLHLHELKATLPQYETASAQEWLSAVEALSIEGKLKGKFLRDGMSIADVAALQITESGRLHLKQSASSQHARKSEPSLRVFICHSSSDKEPVRTLYAKLKADGFNPWLDEEDILPGQDWEHEIRQAVRFSHIVIVCLSPSSITKEGYVQKEIRIALDVAEEKPPGTIFLIPARLHDCQVPERLQGSQWVDLFVDRGYERLVTALRRREAQLGLRGDLSPQNVTKILTSAQPGARASLADKMKRALQEREAAEDAARSQQQRQVELSEVARKAGPAQFDALAALLRAKSEALNNENLSGFPSFKYVAVNHRLDAGKYAIELSPYATLDSYSVTVNTGLHPNAAQFMAELPDVPTHTQSLVASVDQQGFFWRDQDGRKCDGDRILEEAMELVCNLILEDIRGGEHP
jgi:hypothetical protein